MAVLLLPAIPILAIGGVLITCDTPLVCCWTWAAVWTYRAPACRRSAAWIAAGLIGALGVWAKYSFLAFPASVGLFLLSARLHRRQLLRPGFWTMSLLCVGLGLAPILIWNSSHGWAGAGQLADRVGLSSRATWASIWPVLTFLGGDVAALGGVWWIAGVAAVVAAMARIIDRQGPSRPRRRANPPSSAIAGLIYLLCLWGVIWTACLAASLLGETEANWMVPGYISLVILIGMRVDQRLCQRRPEEMDLRGRLVRLPRRGRRDPSHRVVLPAFARFVPEPTARWPVPLRVYEPTARMRGHQVLARAVEETVAALDAKGESPFVLTPTYGLASTLSFYLPGQPETYCLSWNYGMTPSPSTSTTCGIPTRATTRMRSGPGRDRGGRRQYAA